MEAIEKINVDVTQQEATEAVEKGDHEALGKLVDRLEAQRRAYEGIVYSSEAERRKAESELRTIKNQLAYNPNGAEQYRESQLAVDLHDAHTRAAGKEAEVIRKLLPQLRQGLEKLLGRRKAQELLPQAQEIKAALGAVKAEFLPKLTEALTQAQRLINEANTHNATTQTAKLPVPVLLCEDLGKLMRLLGMLDLDATRLEQVVEPAPDGQRRVILRVNWQGAMAGRQLVLPQAEAEQLVTMGFARMP